MEKRTKLALVLMLSGFGLLMGIPYILADILGDVYPNPIVASQHTIMMALLVFIAMMVFYDIFIRDNKTTTTGAGVGGGRGNNSNSSSGIEGIRDKNEGDDSI